MRKLLFASLGLAVILYWSMCYFERTVTHEVEKNYLLSTVYCAEKELKNVANVESTLKGLEVEFKDGTKKVYSPGVKCVVSYHR